MKPRKIVSSSMPGYEIYLPNQPEGPSDVQRDRCFLQTNYRGVIPFLCVPLTILRIANWLLPLTLRSLMNMMRFVAPYCWHMKDVVFDFLFTQQHLYFSLSALCM
jgi:hypothetical protein